MAAFGNRNGLRRLAFTRCAGDANTALRVTSAPDPAVVGRAKNGAEGRVRGCPSSDNLQVIERLARISEQGGDGFAAIDGAAAADRDHRAAFLAPCLLHARAHQIDSQVRRRRRRASRKDSR